MKITMQAVQHSVTIPALFGHPSDWSVEDLEDVTRRWISRYYGEKARILSLHADHYEINATIEVDEIHIEYAAKQEQ